jgi:peptidoglycan-associated lipoprotein
MSFTTSRFTQLTALVVLTMAMAACSSPKKPLPITNAAPPAPAAQQAAPTNPPRQAPPVQSQAAPPRGPTGPVPGSLQDFVVSAGDRVFFDYDSTAIRADAAPILDAQASWLARYPQVKVRIEGNADERGTREYNFALGAQRASAVKDYLIRKGVSAGRIDTVSYGKERPIDGGDNEAAWARNRNGHTAITGGAS